jgi:lysozyme family protein
MNGNFKFAVHHTLAEEGVFSNHERDPGGRTKYGITQKSWSSYRDDQVLMGADPDGLPADVFAITPTQAEEVYYENYWMAPRLNLIEDKHVAAEVFDSGVNCGPVSAVWFLQGAINFCRKPDWNRIQEDGHLGPETRNAIRRLVAQGYRIPLLLAMNAEQYIHYKRIGNQHMSRGWTRRLMLAKDLVP